MEGFIRRAENEGDMTRKQKSGTRVGTGRGTVPFIVFIQLQEMDCKSLFINASSSICSISSSF